LVVKSSDLYKSFLSKALIIQGSGVKGEYRRMIASDGDKFQKNQKGRTYQVRKKLVRESARKETEEIK
jgi:hypothetical protein